MEIKIQSIHFDATEKLQAFIEKKVAKLEKTYEDIQKVEVQLKVIKPATALNKEVHLEVAVPGTTLFVEKTCDTFEEGIDQAVDSMKVQLTKFKEKTRNRFSFLAIGKIGLRHIPVFVTRTPYAKFPAMLA